MDGLSPQDLLRILCGVWFLPHAALKVKNAALAKQTFAKVGRASCRERVSRYV